MKWLKRGLVITAGVIFTTAFATVQAVPEKPSQVWFTSWMAWLTFFLVICDIIARLFGVYRLGASGITKKLDDQTRHFDDKMLQLEQRLETKFNGFTANSELRLNGMGERLETVETDQIGANAKMTVFEGRMSASEMDRQHLRLMITEIKQGQDTILNYILNQKKNA